MLAMLANESAPIAFGLLCGQCVYPSNSSTLGAVCITSYSYDIDGHVTQVNSPEGVINYGYNLATGRMTLLCTTNSEQDYAYDALGRLYTVTVAKRNSVAVTNETTMYHYDATGNRSEVDLPNGVVTTYRYDSLNRLTNMVHKLGSTNLAIYSYILSATGRRTSATEVLLQETSSYQTNTLTWQYDGMYRLTNEINVTTSSAGPYAYTNAYSYDLVGNRLQKTQSSAGTATDTYNYNANDELTNEVDGSSAINYLYDSNGSLTNKANVTATNSYTYDLANKLNGVSVSGSLQANYYYNDDGIRVETATTTGSTYFLIDDNSQTGYAQVLEELSTLGGTPSMSYVMGDDVLAQCGPGPSAPSYFLLDGHGNNRQLVQMNGGVFTHYTYDAYGNVQSTVSSSTADYAVQHSITSKFYSGEQYDLNLKMYNLRARYYDPLDGEFNQRDAFAGNNDDPQSLHKYLYANCDPINVIDPSGKQGLLAGLLIDIAIDAISFAVTAYPYLRIAFAIWNIITIANIIYKIATGQPVSTADIVSAIASTAGFILGTLVKIINSAKIGLAITSSLRTLAGAKAAVSDFCHLDEMALPEYRAGRIITGKFKVILGNPTITYFKDADELKSAHTIIHEFIHYLRWKSAGGPVGKAFEIWEKNEYEWEEATKSLYSCADGTTGLPAKLSEIILEMANW